MCSPWGWGLYTIVELPSGIVGLHAARAWRARPPPSRLIKGSSRAHQRLVNGSSTARRGGFDEGASGSIPRRNLWQAGELPQRARDTPK